MAQQIINVGSSANDGTGDVLRVSQQKANANFTELYNIVDGYLSSDETSYTDATLPLSDTDELLVNQGGTWKKVDKSEIGGEVTPSDLISSDSNNALIQGTDSKLFVPEVNTADFLSSDETSYPGATLPLSGTEKVILNDGTGWKNITWNNIKAQLKNYFDTIYQTILVSGTNIKTINGSSILGSGNLTVGGGGDTVLDFAAGSTVNVAATERVSLNNHFLIPDTNVTKSGSLITGPYSMVTANVIKTSTIKRLIYRFIPESIDTTFVIRIYSFKQNKNATSLYDCRLLLEKTLVTGTLYGIQKYNFVTADFLDANMIDGEFIAFTTIRPGTNSFQLKAQNLTIIY